MFLKLLVENCDGQTPILELGEGALVIGVKLALEEITGAPGERLHIQFRGRMLDDQDLMYLLFQECQDLDMHATGEAQHNTNFVVIYRSRVLCRLRFVDDPRDTYCEICDRDFMDEECHAQSSSKTKRRDGRGSVSKLWSKVVTWLFKKRR